MTQCQLPKNETERLKKLRDLKILDTVPEVEYEQIVELASLICEVPIAVISLVDESRQWFKAIRGLDAKETPRDVSFCSHAILQDQILNVPDANKDERFSGNPLVLGGPKIQFYAGAPIKSTDGKFLLGTVCFIDAKPKELNEKQLQALKALADQVSKLFSLRETLLTLQETNQDITFKTSAFKQMHNGYVLQDSMSTIIDFNPSALKILDLTESQLLGKTSYDPYWCAVDKNGMPITGEKHPSNIALATGEVQKDCIMGIKTQNHPTRWLNITSTPLFLGKTSLPSHTVTTFEDITNQLSLTEKVIQDSRFSALGEMSSGIAHEINSPLAAISGTAELLKRGLSKTNLDKADLLQKIERIESSSMKIASIVKSMRLLTKSTEYVEKEILKVKNTIQETLNLVRSRLTSSGISVIFDSTNESQVLCNPGALSQALINLISNSREALTDRSEKWIQISLNDNTADVLIKIQDSGEKIPPHIVKKIMDPFFSTKEIGNAKGLGLSVAKGLIESSGGTLEYLPDEEFTSFLITLPRQKTESL